LVSLALALGADSALGAHIPQSPVDFTGVVGGAKPKLLFGGYHAAFAWEATTTRSAKGTTESIKITPKGAAPSLTWDGVQYDLKNIHFHIHSEHTEDGVIFPMEMHIVHAQKDLPDDDAKKNLAIGRWIKEGDADANTLKPIFDNLPPVPPLGVNPPHVGFQGFAVDKIIPPQNKRDLYQYEGSLTTELVIEDKAPVMGHPDLRGQLVSKTKVNWFVFDEPLFIPRTQMDKFRAHFQNGNWRETQMIINNLHMVKKGAAVPERGVFGLLASGTALVGAASRRRGA
jgi:carbonic anhydrase